MEGQLGCPRRASPRGQRGRCRRSPRRRAQEEQPGGRPRLRGPTRGPRPSRADLAVTVGLVVRARRALSGTATSGAVVVVVHRASEVKGIVVALFVERGQLRLTQDLIEVVGPQRGPGWHGGGLGAAAVRSLGIHATELPVGVPPTPVGQRAGTVPRRCAGPPQSGAAVWRQQRRQRGGCGGPPPEWPTRRRGG